MRIGSACCLLYAAFVIAGCGGGSNSGGGGGGTTKTTPTVSVWPTASAITYGQTLASSTLTGGSASVSGSFSWTTPTTAPGAGTPNEGVTFTPSDTTDYNTVSGSVGVVVSKATPTVTAWPTASAITYGQTLASSILSSGTASVPGGFSWTTPGTAPSTGTTSEGATFTPTDASDDNTVGGSVSVTVNPATPPPTVTTVTPTNGSTDVGITSAVTANFSQAMNLGTITTSTFTLTGPGNTFVQGTVGYNAGTSVATFTPAADLAYSTTYTATLSTIVMSTTGVALSAPYTWSFTTTTPPVPTVKTTVPMSGAMNVNIGNALTATFSQPMNSSTVTATTFTLTGPGNTAVAGLVTYNTGTSTATFTPNASLAYNTSYTATITTGAQSSAGAALASNYGWTFTTGASPNQVTVDFGTTYQTIRGFGGSTAWLGSLTTQQATALFNPTICTGSNSGSCGLGLSILRVRIDPEGTSTTAPPYYTGEWAAELTNAIEAKAANSNAIVFASPWTPPASMKTNATVSYSSCGGEGVGYCGGSLITADYGAYAQYLEDFVTYFANNGVNLYGISMQNEPDENVDYESCVWTGAQMDSWVASLTANGATNPLTTKLIMPESAVFNTGYSDPTLDDLNAVGNVAIIGGHLYMNGESQGSPFYYTNAENAGKDVWMTEHYLTPPGSQPTITDALSAAEEIHNSMTVGQYNAYVWWWIWEDLNASSSLNYGLINSNTTSPAPTYYGDAIGQFSEFIQPGYVRVSATSSPVSGVYISAYSNSSPSHSVIVAINSNTSSESLTFVLNNGTATSVTPYETTATSTIAAQTAVTVSGGQFNYTLPAQSIVTFYQ